MMRMNRRTLQLAARGGFVRGRVERMTREAERVDARGKKALRIMWIVCRQDCGSARAWAAWEVIK